MLVVKTKVKPSSIDGLGLYAEEEIRYGEIVEIVETDFSYKVFTQEQVDKFDELKRQYEHDYTFKIGNNYYATIDLAKFMNHSDTPNLFWRETIDEARPNVIGYFFAVNDIKVGDELTVDYNMFCLKGCDW